MPEETSDNGRQDFRINDVIPVSDERMSAEDYQINKTKVGVRSRQNGMLRQMVGRDIFSADHDAEASSEMSQALEALDAKLDYLIGVNMLNDATRGDMQERPVNLSVTGISFTTRNYYQLGEAIAINLMLPSFPPSILELLGTVVRAPTPNDKKQHVGVKFYFRCDDEEDTIAKYVYRRHRETIRSESRNKVNAVDSE